MGTRPAYLDHNATTPVLPDVQKAILETLAVCGNPSSVHQHGRKARQRLERARRQVADFVGAARREQVVFTSGGTESIHAALRGLPGHSVLVSAIEHDAVLAAANQSPRIPVTGQGIVDVDALEVMIRQRSGRPLLVSTMWANNETGAIQPINEIVSLCRRHGARVHCDAVQAVGKIPVEFAASDLDLLSLSAHKFGGPPGVGALLIHDRIAWEPSQVGGGQERRRRSGTENLPGIVGLGTACEVVARALTQKVDRMRSLRDRLESRIRAGAPGARILCHDVERLPNTTCLVMPGVAAETQVIALDLEGISVSAGSACSSGKVSRSHVIDAMEPDSDAAACAIRISLGPGNDEHDVDRLVRAWLTLYKRQFGA